MGRRQTDMPGDFDERLAAVDDALADTETAASSPHATATRSGTDSDTTAARGSSPNDRPGDSAGRRDGNPPTEPEAGAVDVSALTDRVSELEAAVQALRGYTGSVRAVNDRVEERADAALATVETLQDRVDALERRLDERTRSDGGVDRRSSGPDERRPSAREQPGSASSGVDTGSVRSLRSANGASGSRDTSEDRNWIRSDRDGTPSAWPPDHPREPYGDRPTDDDTDGRGLVARLRDLL